MIKDGPESASFYVVTPSDHEPLDEELAQAAKLSYQRAFAARDICPRVGSCAVKVQAGQVGEGGGDFRVDEYYLDCDRECALLIPDRRQAKNQ